MFEALQKGTPARAEKLGRLAVAIDPTNAEAHRNLGVALGFQGRIDEAIREVQASLQLQPDSAEARDQLARLLNAKAARDAAR